MTHMDNEAAVIVLTTWPASADPGAFATTIVEEKLAACVNVLPVMDSVFRWQGRVDRERERQLVMKTSRATLEALQVRIVSLHPYDVPEVLVLPVIGGSAEYLRWLAESVTA
jgi:periplasmic divalent cation tolerance protein